MNVDFGTMSVWLAAVAPLLVLALALAVDKRNRKRTERPPQSEKLLRPPGYSLAIRFDETIDKILRDIGIACCFSAFAGASAYCVATFLAAHVSAFALLIAVLSLVVFAVAGTLAALRAFARMREAQNIRLGLRGEQAVAEVLHEIGDCGFRAFHDFPGGNDWNIDHVAVGTRGVFLIETKARRRRKSRNGQAEHVIVYDGEALRFPYCVDRKAVPQAQRNAKWLSNYLTKKTGESVDVKPIVVLPGWFVDGDKRGDFPVKAMNAAYLASYLRGQGESIDPPQVRRIIAALDEKCRDVEF